MHSDGSIERSSRILSRFSGFPSIFYTHRLPAFFHFSTHRQKYLGEKAECTQMVAQSDPQGFYPDFLDSQVFFTHIEFRPYLTICLTTDRQKYLGEKAECTQMVAQSDPQGFYPDFLDSQVFFTHIDFTFRLIVKNTWEKKQNALRWQHRAILKDSIQIFWIPKYFLHTSNSGLIYNSSSKILGRKSRMHSDGSIERSSRILSRFSGFPSIFYTHRLQALSNNLSNDSSSKILGRKSRMHSDGSIERSSRILSRFSGFPSIFYTHRLPAFFHFSTHRQKYLGEKAECTQMVAQSDPQGFYPDFLDSQVFFTHIDFRPYLTICLTTGQKYLG